MFREYLLENNINSYCFENACLNIILICVFLLFWECLLEHKFILFCVQDMGFPYSQAMAAIKKHTTVQAALESLLTGTGMLLYDITVPLLHSHASRNYLYWVMLVLELNTAEWIMCLLNLTLVWHKLTFRYVEFDSWIDRWIFKVKIQDPPPPESYIVMENVFLTSPWNNYFLFMLNSQKITLSKFYWDFNLIIITHLQHKN